MGTGGKKDSIERELTDESLRVERANIDRTRVERQEAVDDDADLVLHRARENADAILGAARARADLRLVHLPPHVGPGASISEERALEDQALRDQRASADEVLRREREAIARALARLLPLERDTTDKYLLTERDHSDDALSNRDDFLGLVSHDLRDLLGGIVVSATLVTANAPQGASGTRTLLEMERIQRYAARMTRLIGDLLDVASIDAGKLAIAPVEGDLPALLTESISMFEASAAAKGVTLETAVTERPAIAAFDHDRMLQVVGNLIANSIKFTPHGGKIIVSCERAGDAFRLSVSDTGTGIPSDMLEHVFERFRQVGKLDQRGLGLGLYISKCIVEEHGGAIWGESTLGAGSRFFFTLPAPRG